MISDPDFLSLGHHLYLMEDFDDFIDFLIDMYIFCT